MSLRLESFNDFDRPYMAAGNFMFGGMAVVISPNVPKFHAADNLVYVKPAWIWRALWRLFGANPDALIRFKPGEPIMEDQALFVGAAQKLFVSPSLADQLLAGMKTLAPRATR